MTVSLNGNKIPAHHIGGLAVNVEDLKNYGFAVEYREISNSYHVTGYDSKKQVQPMQVEKNTAAAGSKKGEYFYTSKTVFVKGEQVQCYEVNGKAVVLTTDLEAFVNRTWDGAKEEIIMTAK
jgi:hypothetical protein